ncbi:MAG: CopG family transcriptional regulator [Desulfurococcales archaeon ex4484_42]|nr:MAG: CopG family transcriptional regulator [Desulfurococcales archaeon ex4484_42]
MLVQLGVFSSRSEALRELIKAGMKEFRLVIDVIKAVENFLNLREKGDIPIRLDGALKQLLEERGRF